MNLLETYPHGDPHLLPFALSTFGTADDDDNLPLFAPWIRTLWPQRPESSGFGPLGRVLVSSHLGVRVMSGTSRAEGRTPRHNSMGFCGKLVRARIEIYYSS